MQVVGCDRVWRLGGSFCCALIAVFLFKFLLLGDFIALSLFFFAQFKLALTLFFFLLAAEIRIDY